MDEDEEREEGDKDKEMKKLCLLNCVWKGIFLS
jgi:hypothetical protein